MRLLAVLLAACSLGCQALSSSGIEYVECLPNTDGIYIERFDGPLPHATNCWKTDNIEEPGYVQEHDGDLIIHPDGNHDSQWFEMEQAPFVFHEVTGDFLAVTRVEAVSGLAIGDHCLNETEAAGLVVRWRAPFAWTNLLVRPDLTAGTGGMLMDPEWCGDDPTVDTFARITTQSFGLMRSDEAEPIGGRGADAEAEIAICRVDDQLYYFAQQFPRRADDPVPPNLEPVFTPLEVGSGPVDVGVTVTAATEVDTQRAGHFSWLFLHDYGDEHLPEGCPHVLESFIAPEDE